MHVPLVFAGPGIPEGDTDALVYLMDVFPTVCDLAGMSIPANVEGKSLAPIINDRSSGVRDWLYTGYQDGQRSVTNGRWKLIRYPLIDKTQLFDLREDSLEKNDLAAKPKHAERIQSMMDKLAELQRQYDDPVPLSVPDPQPAAWSPEQLTPEQIEYQIAETERCRDAKPM
jgi:arylsulfatase A-like enzyme